MESGGVVLKPLSDALMPGLLRPLWIAAAGAVGADGDLIDVGDGAAGALALGALRPRKNGGFGDLASPR